MRRSIADAYVNGGAAPFFPEHFADPAARRRAVQRVVRGVSPAVADVLVTQNAHLAPSAARDANIAALRQGAAAVVTGQQVGLFLGPLFTIYKAASAIRVARALATESGQPVVPVFWLQTEDHDLAEIAACNVPRTGGSLTLRHPAGDAEHISIAHRTLGDPVQECCAALDSAIGHLPYAAAHLALLRRHYRPGIAWGRAFAGVIAELFAPEGLMVLDPRDPVLADVGAPIHRHALAKAESIAAGLSARGDALVAAGFEPAVHVRPGSPLSFFHPEGVTGPRCRLVPAAGGLAEIGGARVHQVERLLAVLAAEPLRFSTSALLRPIVQDHLLPTAAYVGGPGEIAYFAQLAPLYAAYGLAMPLIVPRARLRIVEPRTRRLLDRLHLTAADAQRPEDELLGAIQGADARADSSALAHRLFGPFAAALDGAREQIECSGTGLDAAVTKTRAAVEKAVTKLTAKYEKALLHRAHDVVDAVRELKARLYPEGVAQERFYGLSYFAARWGDRAVIARVLAAIVPFAASVQDLEWSEPVAATAVETHR